jgi:anti-sigma-K factor RskA
MSQPRIAPSDYLLGELSDDERAEAERLLSEDAGFRAEVERLGPVVSRLEELPPEGWQELRPGGPPSPTPAPRRRILALRPLTAGLAAAALLAGGVGVGIALRGGDQQGGTGDEVVVALQPVSPSDGSASGAADLRKSGGTATVSVSGLTPSDAGETYELWLLNSPKQLVSLGSFVVPDSGSADVTVELPASASDYRFIDISREPADGDQSHSGDSVLRAEV